MYHHYNNLPAYFELRKPIFWLQFISNFLQIDGLANMFCYLSVAMSTNLFKVYSTLACYCYIFYIRRQTLEPCLGCLVWLYAGWFKQWNLVENFDLLLFEFIFMQTFLHWCWLAAIWHVANTNVVLTQFVAKITQHKILKYFDHIVFVSSVLSRRIAKQSNIFASIRCTGADARTQYMCNYHLDGHVRNGSKFRLHNER